MIKAIVFDVFGTLAEIGDRRRPYARLLRLAAQAGRISRPDDAARIMSINGDIWAIATWLGLALSPALCDELADELAIEISSIRLYPEVVPVLRALQRQGLQLGLCSNLAKPYALPVLSLLPFEFDAYAWSFEVGVVKPDHRIYSTVWQSLALSPGEVLMVGDTYEADCLGPRRVGMHAIHLARNLASPDPRFLRSLSDLPAYLALHAPPSVPQ